MRLILASRVQTVFKAITTIQHFMIIMLLLEVLKN
jgi:hypothetical protein